LIIDSYLFPSRINSSSSKNETNNFNKKFNSKISQLKIHLDKNNLLKDEYNEKEKEKDIKKDKGFIYYILYLIKFNLNN
jgi:hypothetical protein